MLMALRIWRQRSRLRSTREDVRTSALSALAGMHDSRAASLVVVALGDRAEAVRRAAERAIRRMDDGKAIEPLASAATNGDAAIRLFVVNELARRGGRPVVEALATASGDADPVVRLAAVEALAQRDDAQAFEALIAVLERHAASDDSRRRAASITEIVHMSVEMAIPEPKVSRERVHTTLPLHDEVAFVAAEALMRRSDPLLETARVRDLIKSCQGRLVLRVLEREVQERLRSSFPSTRRGDFAAFGE
jgi:hypothetical protein